MKNGVELRPNGSRIEKYQTIDYAGYNVFFADGVASGGNPWCYLSNARRDADGGYPPNSRESTCHEALVAQRGKKFNSLS